MWPTSCTAHVAQHSTVCCTGGTSDAVRKRVLRSSQCVIEMHETIATSEYVQGEVNTLWASKLQMNAVRDCITVIHHYPTDMVSKNIIQTGHMIVV